jgi:hypothetical protein
MKSNLQQNILATYLAVWFLVKQGERVDNGINLELDQLMHVGFCVVRL